MGIFMQAFDKTHKTPVSNFPLGVFFLPKHAYLHFCGYFPEGSSYAYVNLLVSWPLGLSASFPGMKKRFLCFAHLSQHLSIRECQKNVVFEVRSLKKCFISC